MRRNGFGTVLMAGGIIAAAVSLLSPMMRNRRPARRMMRQGMRMMNMRGLQRMMNGRNMRRMMRTGRSLMRAAR